MTLMFLAYYIDPILPKNRLAGLKAIRIELSQERRTSFTEDVLGELMPRGRQWNSS